ncbi:hypothetical protein MMPV_003377 [Pyropia vietnamensis]
MVLRGVIYALGGAARRAGMAMDAAGCRLQGPTAYSESLSRHQNVMPFNSGGTPPSTRFPAAFVAPTASVLGAVSATPSVSVWYGATVRGDVAPVSLADRSAVMDGAIVGANGVVDAGAVVPSNTTIQAGTRHAGAPAVLSGSVLPAEVSAIATASDEVVTLAAAHAAENAKSAAQVRSEALLTELRTERSQDNLAHMGLLGREEEVAAAQAVWYEREERKQAEAGGRQ